MNLYTYFYCKAFDWYNTNGKKDNDVLRVSSIVLLSVFMALNISSVVLVISLVQRRTPVNKWGGLAMIVALYIFNFLRISSSRSEILRTEYTQLAPEVNRRWSVILISYVIVSVLLVLFLGGMIIYVKKQYGNYDL